MDTFAFWGSLVCLFLFSLLLIGHIITRDFSLWFFLAIGFIVVSCFNCYCAGIRLGYFSSDERFNIEERIKEAGGQEFPDHVKRMNEEFGKYGRPEGVY